MKISEVLPFVIKKTIEIRKWESGCAIWLDDDHIIGKNGHLYDMRIFTGSEDDLLWGWDEGGEAETFIQKWVEDLE